MLFIIKRKTHEDVQWCSRANMQSVQWIFSGKCSKSWRVRILEKDWWYLDEYDPMIFLWKCWESLVQAESDRCLEGYFGKKWWDSLLILEWESRVSSMTIAWPLLSPQNILYICLIHRSMRERFEMPFDQELTRNLFRVSSCGFKNGESIPRRPVSLASISFD